MNLRTIEDLDIQGPAAIQPRDTVLSPMAMVIEAQAIRTASVVEATQAGHTVLSISVEKSARSVIFRIGNAPHAAAKSTLKDH